MMYQLSDGSITDGYSAIEYPAGILRPPLWIQSLSLDEKSALGIHEWTPPVYVHPEPDPPKPMTAKEKLERTGLSLEDVAEIIEMAQAIVKKDPAPDKTRD